MIEDAFVRDVADQFLPPEDPGFFDEFWSATAQRERLHARRWRRVSLAVATLALAAISAAAVVASPFGRSSTVDQRVSCALRTQGGKTVVNLAVAPTRKPHAGYKQSASAQAIIVGTRSERTTSEWSKSTAM